MLSDLWLQACPPTMQRLILMLDEPDQVKRVALSAVIRKLNELGDDDAAIQRFVREEASPSMLNLLLHCERRAAWSMVPNRPPLDLPAMDELLRAPSLRRYLLAGAATFEAFPLARGARLSTKFLTLTDGLCQGQVRRPLVAGEGVEADDETCVVEGDGFRPLVSLRVLVGGRTGLAKSLLEPVALGPLAAGGLGIAEVGTRGVVKVGRDRVTWHGSRDTGRRRGRGGGGR